MARPRLPQDKAKASGAALKNPGRFKNRTGPKSTRPVGEPYAAMNEAQARHWRELAAELPWLHSGHRALLRLACQFMARSDEGDLGVSAAMALSSILSKLGATPVDETKVTHGGEEDDPDEGFDFGRPN